MHLIRTSGRLSGARLGLKIWDALSPKYLKIKNNACCKIETVLMFSVAGSPQLRAFVCTGVDNLWHNGFRTVHGMRCARFLLHGKHQNVIICPVLELYEQGKRIPQGNLRIFQKRGET